MRALLIIARASGLLLVVAAVFKAIDARDTSESFTDYFHFSSYLAFATVAVLCVLEFGVGVWAMARPHAAAPVVMVLFAAFTGWHIAFRLLVGEDSCSCFGRLTLFGTEGPQVAFAPALAAIAVVHFLIAAKASRAPSSNGR